MSTPEFFNPHAVAAPVGQYSHGGFVKAGSDILFIAGQVGVRPDGTLPASLEEQADAAYANVIKVLAAKGLTLANLVKVNSFLRRDSRSRRCGPRACGISATRRPRRPSSMCRS